MPVHNQGRSNDLKRNQLFAMWQITTRRHMMKKLPEDHKIKEIKEKFADMLPIKKPHELLSNDPGEVEEWRELKIKHRDAIKLVENTPPGEEIPRISWAARVDLERFFRKIAVRLGLTIREIRQRVEMKPEKDLLIKMFRITMFQHEFLSWEDPDTIKNKFLQTLETAHQLEFNDLQKRHGRYFWWRMSDHDIPDNYLEIENELDLFFDKVAKTLGMSVAELYSESSPEFSPFADADQIQYVEPDDSLFGLRITFCDPEEQEPEDDDDTVMGEEDRTYMN
ncbi:hypothetical protein DM02DRAFT_630974 [Periconia macrospinosa]|uniref:Uncharacterized protein n=1 Tax=Periconia macrospinosa TaxID=97972 RepID=A0A2V1DHS3_9PLEO|nr:hypothetical protein DM02DRAFT_630974 [Periconia macrospinosa]